MMRPIRQFIGSVLALALFGAGSVSAAEQVAPEELARQALKNPASVLTAFSSGAVIEALVHEVQVFDLPDGGRIAGVFLGRDFVGGYTIKNFSPFVGQPFEIVCGFPLDVAAGFERKQKLRVKAVPIDIKESSDYNSAARRHLTTTTLVAECELAP